MKKLNSISVKLGLAIIMLILVILFPLGYVLDNVLKNYFFSRTYQELTIQGERLVDLITNNNDIDASKMIVNTMKITDHIVFLLDSSGEIVVQSNTELNINEVLFTNDWLVLQSGSSINKQITNTNSNYLLVGKPIIYNSKYFGSVLILSSTEEINRSISQVKKFIWLTGLGAIFLALGFTIVVVRKFSVPLLEMEQATRFIAKGDLTVKIKQRTNDELGSLAVAINDLVSDLKRYQDTRSEFFSNISHELRTPLTYIEGYIQLLKEDAIKDIEQKKQILEIITNETKRLKGLVNDLFDLSKLEEGKFELTLEWIDIGEVIDNALDYVKLRANAKHVQLEIQIDNVPLMFLDGNRMQQVFINLLDNAIRYTSNGFITLKVKNEKTFIYIEITDTGIGIPEGELAFIFDRFHRVEKSRSREYGGTGLGLAIVKKLVELQGGKINVSSQVGVGTTFTLEFPTILEERSE